MKNLVVVLLIVVLVPFAEARQASLKGSRASLEKQKAVAEEEDLSEIQNEKQLKSMKNAGFLVPLPNDKYCRRDNRLPSKYYYGRQWTVDFLMKMSRAFYEKFSKPIQINSAVRTVEYQKRLRKRNRNATTPDKCSHVRGTTVDIARLPHLNGAKRWYSLQEEQWIRNYLLKYEGKGMIEATEEKKQAVFHVMVFKTYKSAKK